MKTKNLLTIAALTLMTAACSNDDNLVQQPAEQPADNNEITVTATLAPKSGDITRAVAYNGTTITSSWAEGEQIAILFDISGTPSKRIAEVKSVDISDGAATIEFTIPASGVTDGANAKLVYPATAAKDDNSGAKTFTDLLAEQDGTLKADLDVRVGAGTINTSTNLLTVTTNPDAQFAIFKLTLNKSIDATHPLYIYDGTDNLISTVTPTSSMEEPYVAMPATGNSAFYSFVVDVDNNKYYKSGTATINPGYFYTQVMNLAARYPRAMASATKIDLGSLIGQDGKIYANAAGITAASTTAVAAIAYIGTDNFTENGTMVNSSAFTGHGLALCLKNAAANVAWCNEYGTSEFGVSAEVQDVAALKRSENVSGYTNTTTLATKTDAATKYPAAYQAKNYTGLTAPAGSTGWFLPSAQQWVKMIEGLGKLADGAPVWNSWFDNNHTAADKWEATLAKAGDGNYHSMTEGYLRFASSSECNSGNGTVYLIVYAMDTGDNYGFNWSADNKIFVSGNDRVRPIFAF